MIDDAIRDAVRQVMREEITAALADLRDSLGTIAPVVCTVDEAASVLRLSPESVRNLVDRGALIAVPHGLKRVHISRTELERFAREGSADRHLRSA